MSKLQQFLNANPVSGMTKEVVVSDRFKDEKGNILKFTIRAISPSEFEEIRKRALIVKKGGKEFEFDTGKFNMDLIVNCTVDPNFKDAESIKALGCVSPDQYVNKVLLAGEVEELANQIREFSGFDKDLDELVDEAKN